MAYYLAVDGGGTKTVAIITDKEGVILGFGLTGNCNHQISREAAEFELKTATEEALKSAGIKQSMLFRSCFGLAGADTANDFKIIHTMLQNLGFDKYAIYNDGLIALRAADPAFAGITIICGTATNAIGRDREGNIYQVGGYGYAFGDFGGGHQLSKEIFRLVIRSTEGREPETLLTHLVLNKLGFKHMNAMYAYYLINKKSIPVHLTPLLFSAAEKGDEPASQLIERQAEELVLSTAALAEKMKLSSASFSLVLAGSVLTKSKNDLMYRAFLSKLGKTNLNAKVKLLKVEPVIGSSLLAIGDVVDEEKVRQNLIQSLPSVTKGSDADEQN
ncbi:N-acetylglucosamine kinase [Virgibacillus oceani]